MGSAAFFKVYSDFNPKDIDTLEFTKDLKAPNLTIIRGNGEDRFIFKLKSKEEMIQDALNSKLPMVVGKFLIPEFCQKIGFAIEDLPRLQKQIDILDKKHSYEQIIYNAYILNRAFVLTDEQRLEAYKLYIKSREE